MSSSNLDSVDESDLPDTIDASIVRDAADRLDLSDSHDFDTATGLASFRQLASGDNHNCAIRADSSIVCWGNNTFGELDSSDDAFTSVSIGDNRSCGVKTEIESQQVV